MWVHLIQGVRAPGKDIDLCSSIAKATHIGEENLPFIAELSRRWHAYQIWFTDCVSLHLLSCCCSNLDDGLATSDDPDNKALEQSSDALASKHEHLHRRLLQDEADQPTHEQHHEQHQPQDHSYSQPCQHQQGRPRQRQRCRLKFRLRFRRHGE